MLFPSSPKINPKIQVSLQKILVLEFAEVFK